MHIHHVGKVSLPTQPPTVACKMKPRSEYVHVACTFLARLAPTCVLSQGLLKKISASELSRKFIKSALFGWVVAAANSPILLPGFFFLPFSLQFSGICEGTFMGNTISDTLDDCAEVKHVSKSPSMHLLYKPTAVVVLDTPVPVRSLKLSNIEPG